MGRYQGPDGTIYEDAPGGGYVVVSGPAQQPSQPYTIGTPDPAAQYAAPKAATDLLRAQQQYQQDAAVAPYAAQKARADALTAVANARSAQITAAQGGQGNRLSAEERAKALASFQAANQLNHAIADIAKRYAAGPGATSGIVGLQDYLPTTENQRFDAAGNAVRGLVGQALGFTGGQLNTEREAAAAVGPYLPQAGDRDSVIQDKIARLRELANTARQRSISVLGGAPDANGNISPVTAPNTAAAVSPSGPAGYDVGGVAPGVVTSGTGKGNDFTSAAGLAMAKKVSDAYTRGATLDDLNRLLQDNGYPAFTNPNDIKRIQQRGPISFAPPPETDQRGGITRAVGAMVDNPVGAYGAAAGDALSLGTLDNIAGGNASLALDYGQQKYGTASMLGNITGGALAAGGIEAGLGAAGARIASPIASRLLSNPITADAAFGAGYGAGSNEDAPLTGALTGALAGVGGGVAGRGVATAAGNGLRGVQSQAVRTLRDRGVNLTAGQALSQSGVLGRALKGVEDRLTGIPGIGSVVNDRRLEGVRDFNRVALNEAVAPVSQVPITNVGEQGVDAARQVVSDAYGNALNGVQVAIDPQFTAAMQGVRAQGARLPGQMADNAAYTLGERVDASFTPQSTLSGNNFQQAVRGLRQDARGLRNQPYGHDFGQVARGAEGALTGLLDRQAPNVVPAYQAANAANRRISILRDAVNAARNGSRSGEGGLFMPSQVADAAAANAKKFDQTQGTASVPFFDLTSAARDVLPSRVPDSGTAGRLATMALPATLGGAGAGVGYAGGDAGEGAKWGLGVGALLAAGGTRAGQRALTSALLDRPQAAVRAGNRLLNNRRLGGMFGAPLLVTALPPQ